TPSGISLRCDFGGVTKYSNKSCKYCKKLGHIVSDCYKLMNKLDENNEKKPEKAAEVAIAKGDSDGDVYLAIDIEKYRDELIVDSGYTFHMIPHQSWFITYESFNGGNMYMGNHSICHVIGMGNIQVKMHDGVIRTITEASLNDSKLCHYRLGYMGEKGMKNLAKKGLIKASRNLKFCEHCVFVKQKRVSFSPCIHRTRDALEYIHSNLWGPSPVTYRGGKRYMLNIIDDFSREVWVFFLKHKDEVFPTFKEWKVLIENQIGKKIKKLRTDNGLEFCGESFNSLCRKYGISRHHTLVRTPQQNGVAERMNMTIMEKVVFGCPIYVHVNEGKLVPRTVKCIFLGYGSGVKGKMEFEFDVENSTHTQPPFNDEHIETQDDGNMPTIPQSQPQTKYLLARDRERRQVNRPPRLKDYQCDLVAYAFFVVAYIKKYEPTNYLEAISSPECDKWVMAMEDEVENLHKNKTWELVKLPKEKRVISYKWLFKVQDGMPGVESNGYKSRYVVCGFDQREGIDFNDVFSLVVRHTSIRVLLSIVALQDLELEQLDVKTTFLHGHLEEEIYVEKPEGFKVPRKEDHVCRLKKSLYGLKQSPRKWYKRFDSFMIGHGYDRCSYDECVYLRKFSNGSFLYLVLYMDDMLIAAPNKDQIKELKYQLSNEFNMKDLGAAKRI
nr:retrotransposon protein, putative, Ty1-copia subclass [Tanacetum cinerariifolium]